MSILFTYIFLHFSVGETLHVAYKKYKIKNAFFLGGGGGGGGG